MGISKKRTGRKLSDAMIMRGVSAEKLREELGLESVQSIYKWLRGDSLPTMYNMLKLSLVLEVSMSDLLVMDDEDMNDEEPGNGGRKNGSS